LPKPPNLLTVSGFLANGSRSNLGSVPISRVGVQIPPSAPTQAEDPLKPLSQGGFCVHEPVFLALSPRNSASGETGRKLACRVPGIRLLVSTGTMAWSFRRVGARALLLAGATNGHASAFWHAVNKVWVAAFAPTRLVSSICCREPAHEQPAC
jgi:hypothetical protein